MSQKIPLEKSKTVSARWRPVGKKESLFILLTLLGEHSRRFTSIPYGCAHPKQVPCMHHASTLAFYLALTEANWFYILNPTCVPSTSISTTLKTSCILYVRVRVQEAMETITYSRFETLDIQLDLYLPPELSAGLVPALVHFHGGGMIAGCRKTLFFQQWLKGGFTTCAV